MLAFPSLRQPTAPIRSGWWRTLAIGLAAIPLLVLVAVTLVDGSFGLFTDPRQILTAAAASGAAYVGVARLSQSRRRERTMSNRTHGGMVGLVLSRTRLVVRYPDGAFAFPWSSVVRVRVAAGADGLGAGAFSQIAQQLLLDVRANDSSETIVLHEVFESTEAGLTAQGRDDLGTLIAIADWLTERVQTPDVRE